MNPSNEVTERAAPDLDDALSAVLWLYHRLPRGYEPQSHIERVVKSLATATGCDGDKLIAELGRTPTASIPRTSVEAVAWLVEPTSAANPSMRREVTFDKPQASKTDFTVTPLTRLVPGYVLVPLDSTEAMLHAAEDVPAPRPYGAVYRAMVNAALATPAPADSAAERGQQAGAVDALRHFANYPLEELGGDIRKARAAIAASANQKGE